MSYMFCGCKSLISLPDISKWNTSNVTDMSGMFCCTSFKFFPDISKWNTENVIDMYRMFDECYSLKSFPDISKWKINKKLKKENMFKGVDKKIIPDKFKGCIVS